jgi:hypothetical protein
MPDPILMGKALAVAGAIAIAITIAFAKSSRVGIVSAGTGWAVLGAVLAGLWVLGLLPQWPAHEALDRLLIVVLPGAAAAELVACRFERVGWIARGLVAALTMPVLLQSSSYVADLAGPNSREWSLAITWLVYASSAVMLMGAWAALVRLTKRTQRRTSLACLAGAALGAAPIVIFSGYATGGQFGVPLAGALGGVALGSLLQKNIPRIDGALGIGVVALFSLVAIGRLFAGLTDLNAVLVFIAPLLGWTAELWPSRGRGREVLRLVLAAAPVAIALALAYQQFTADSARSGSGTQDSFNDYLHFGK